jgi:hypothetical protein
LNEKRPKICRNEGKVINGKAGIYLKTLSITK